ncbi:STAS domain-containing protein [Leptospira ellisii]|uniref:Anti-sigma factor antagonist n=1 Tax=Leptospira ellisii TaxID=2023197 RepID=A0A2N0BM80_9LEPT|nr:STAS domain-containing protein [Leptospira ellisii]MDV6236003.1 STAS domain-containing protein [Leptospira ellisii]PJZ94279.1 anti-anti-sigma factor [Leptospira ellisii]PKA04988.1 anti-anti-sigma factor [Leptospira ellisii]
METKSDPIRYQTNDMKLKVEHISSAGTLPGPAVIIQIQGEINIFSAKKLKDAFNEAIDNEIYILLIDVSAVKSMDSSGIASFIAAHARLGKIPNGGLVLFSLTPEIEKMLELTRLKSLLRTATDLSESIRLFAK